MSTCIAYTPIDPTEPDGVQTYSVAPDDSHTAALADMGSATATIGFVAAYLRKSAQNSIRPSTEPPGESMSRMTAATSVSSIDSRIAAFSQSSAVPSISQVSQL